MSKLNINPSISVVIPMFNSEKTIYNTLLSVKKQTALSNVLETIVVNDGSTDNSMRILEKFRSENDGFPIKVVTKKNGGVSSARNLGMESSNGDWIALLDSDDLWVPKKLEMQIKIIKEKPEIDFLGGNLYENDLRILGKKVDKLHKAKIRDLCLKMFPQTSTAIFKKKIFDEIGGYDESQKYAEDGNYFMKICTNYNYYHLNEQMVNFGGGKPEFGFSGLSANLKSMHRGNIKNIKELMRKSIITKKFYVFLRVFYLLKYFRRILITKINQWRK